MAHFHPRVEDLPGEFPVFPLPGALLLPRGKLPLNIFEPRYLAMTDDALGHGRMFGMIQPDTNLPASETFARIYLHGQRYFAEKFGRPATSAWAAINLASVFKPIRRIASWGGPINSNPLD